VRRSESYGVAWNGRAACWRWLLQMRKLRWCTCWHYGFNLIATWHQRLWFKRWRVWGDRVGVRVESCKIVFLWALLIHMFRHFCCRMYGLATIHFVTDIWTDRQTDREMDNSIMPLADCLRTAARSAKKKSFIYVNAWVKTENELDKLTANLPYWVNKKSTKWGDIIITSHALLAS